MKQPKHCKGCAFFHSAGHPQGVRLYTSKYNSWCCVHSTVAHKAVSICIQQGTKKLS